MMYAWYMLVSVIFEFLGHKYKGIFSQMASGGSDALIQLVVDRVYWGKLWSAPSSCRFDSHNHPALEAVDNDFGRVVEAAFE